MTSNANYTLKIVLMDRHDVTKYAKYDTFKIADEADGYRLTVGDYSGDAGDSMANHNGQMFSTRDADNDNSASDCAGMLNGGWWYGSCGDANLNGMYASEDRMRTNGINWYAWYRMDRDTGYSLKKIENDASAVTITFICLNLTSREQKLYYHISQF